MKKHILLLLLVLIVLSLSSCVGGSRTEMLNKASDEEIAEEKLIKIIDYIENKDEEGLKSMFSKRALDESGDFSENADLLFDFFKGEVISWEKSSGPHVSKSTNYGEVIKEVDSYYFVETDKERYFFLINDFQVDDSNADNEGVNMLLVVLAQNRLDIYEEDNEILYKDGEAITPPGIYLPIR
jgi:hypothetical protein